MKIKIVFIIFFIILFTSIYSHIIIPFKNNLDILSLTENNFIDKLYDLNITSNISLGTPFQTIPFNIKLRQYHLIVLSQDSIDGKKIISFNQSNSKSFFSKYNYPEFLDLPELEFGKKSYDNFKIDNNIIEEFNFLLGYDSYYNQSEILGLKNNDFYVNYSFIYQLKNRKYINSSIFYFKFSENNFNEGEIIIGNYPHEIEKNKYKYESYQTIGIITTKYTLYYDIYITKITIGDKIIAEKKILQFYFESYFMRFPFTFKEIVEKEFFNNLIENHKCSFFKHNLKEFFFYICDDDINIKKLKKLEFHSKELNFTFSFKPEELFMKIKDKFIFLICFNSKKYEEEFAFGYFVLQKYLIIFEQERKLIGFYKINKTSYSYSWILTILFGIIIIGLIYYIFLILKKKRKIRANELEDNFEYLPQKNIL
jgi:hypothetical protein